MLGLGQVQVGSGIATQSAVRCLVCAERLSVCQRETDFAAKQTDACSWHFLMTEAVQIGFGPWCRCAWREQLKTAIFSSYVGQNRGVQCTHLRALGRGRRPQDILLDAGRSPLLPPANRLVPLT